MIKKFLLLIVIVISLILFFNDNHNQEVDSKGFDVNGIHKLTMTKYDAKGFDKEGFDYIGYNKEGFDKKGFDKKGFDKMGYDKEGFDINGFNKYVTKRQIKKGEGNLFTKNDIINTFFDRKFINNKSIEDNIYMDDIPNSSYLFSLSKKYNEHPSNNEYELILNDTTYFLNKNSFSKYYKRLEQIRYGFTWHERKEDLNSLFDFNFTYSYKGYSQTLKGYLLEYTADYITYIYTVSGMKNTWCLVTVLRTADKTMSKDYRIIKYIEENYR